MVQAEARISIGGFQRHPRHLPSSWGDDLLPLIFLDSHVVTFKLLLRHNKVSDDLLSVHFFITHFYWDMIRWQPSSSLSSSSPWCSSPWQRERRRGTSCCTWKRTRTTRWRKEGEGWWEGETAGCPCSPAAPSPGRSAPRPPPPPPPTSKSSDRTLNKLVSQFLSNLAFSRVDDNEVHLLG